MYLDRQAVDFGCNLTTDPRDGFGPSATTMANHPLRKPDPIA